MIITATTTANRAKVIFVLLFLNLRFGYKYSNVKVSLHADDFGLTKKITDDILECIDAGVINSVSVMVNGYSFEYAMEQLLKRAG